MQHNRRAMEMVSPLYLNESFGSLQVKPNCLYGIAPNSKTASNTVTEMHKDNFMTNYANYTIISMREKSL